MNDDDAIQYLQKDGNLNVDQMKDITLNDNFYNCIGTYTVKTKDIMYMTDEWGEMEVVVNPDNVKLIDYRFLNIFDLMTQKLVLNYICSKGLVGDDDFLGRSGILNIDKFYAKCRRMLKKVVIDQPKLIIEHLSYMELRIQIWRQHILFPFSENGLGLGFIVHKDEYDSDRVKYKIAHMDCEGEYVDIEFA